MPEPRHWHLMMYDVSEPKALRKVHQMLSAWGKPMQFSVFRVQCTARELEQLRHQLTEVLAPDDRLTVVRLCEGCASRVKERGKELSPLELDTPPFRIA
jgi:CRISPR-associated protein Cas2